MKAATSALERNSEAVAVLREFAFKDAEIWFVRFSLDPLLQRLAVGNKVQPGRGAVGRRGIGAARMQLPSTLLPARAFGAAAWKALDLGH